jgi:hypothetical protein
MGHPAETIARVAQERGAYLAAPGRALRGRKA